ncbi:MAG: hypothetical protein NXI03_07655, partial [Alphaproteobacteria bacterium]|nr:hypothetical protein [Alphaproteobacteria bacterium]
EFGTARDLAHSALDRLRESFDQDPASIPPITGTLTISGKRRTLSSSFERAVSATPDINSIDLDDAVNDGENRQRSNVGDGWRHYSIAAGVSYALSRRKWVPSFRVFTDLRFQFTARRSRARHNSGLRALYMYLAELCDGWDAGVNPLHFSVIAPPRVISNRRLDVRLLNGLDTVDDIYPGAAIGLSDDGPWSTSSYFAVPHDTKLKSSSKNNGQISVGDLTFRYAGPGGELLPGRVAVVSQSDLPPNLKKYLVVSGHATALGGSEDPIRGSIVRAIDSTPGRSASSPQANAVVGNLVRADFPRLNLASAIDAGLVELAGVLTHLPSILRGNPPKMLFGVIVNPFEAIPVLDEPIAREITTVPVTIRSLESGISSGLVTGMAMRFEAVAADESLLEYSGLIEVIGRTNRIGRDGDSGAPVSVEAGVDRELLLGAVALGAKTSPDLSRLYGTRDSGGEGVAYAVPAVAQLAAQDMVLLVS